MVENPPPASKPESALPAAITPALLGWYDRHARDLPWRRQPGSGRADPYRVWLSEIMLQQTTVEAVKPYYARFLAAWPDIAALAAAEDGAVLAAWAGLGYYARARNLLACARQVAGAGGRFPGTEAGLRALPGIGAYTAAAIAAIAFGARAAVVDGNVERVMARLLALETPLPAAKPAIRAALEPLVPADRPGDFAQAMMDLGATLCTPRAPACGRCPLAFACRAGRGADPAGFPRKAPRGPRPVRHGIAYLCRDAAGRVLLGTRPARGLLGGMAEIPNSGWAPDAPPAAAPPLAANWQRQPAGITHVFTHFELRLAIATARVERVAAPSGLRWVAAEALDAEPLPTLFRKVLATAG
jgi:A/G-specific adenine glycosylase